MNPNFSQDRALEKQGSDIPLMSVSLRGPEQALVKDCTINGRNKSASLAREEPGGARRQGFPPWGRPAQAQGWTRQALDEQACGRGPQAAAETPTFCSGQEGEPRLLHAGAGTSGPAWAP